MSERDAQLRQEIVDLVDRQRASARRGNRTLVASVTAFAIAGAITGGTVAAVASGDDDSKLDQVSARAMGLQLVGNHSPILGEPFEQIGHGDGELDLAAMPSGANAIAFALHCTSIGTYTFALNGVELGGISCSDESDTKAGHGGMSTFVTPDATADNTITISVNGSGGYAVWAAWVTRPVLHTSAEQAAALADGVVDEQEYLAGLNRYIECMAQAGFTIDVLDTGEPIVRYVIPGNAVFDGAEDRCYVAEFRELDMEWQISVNG